MSTDPPGGRRGRLADRKLPMRESKKSMFRSMRVFLGVLALSTAAAVAWPQGTPNFSGLWKQDNERCQPKRNSDVTLRIDLRDPELTVETTMVQGSGSARHALQHYSTGGTVSISTGADGDEFHTSIVWSGPSLVFSVEEHEDGRILQSKETWSVIEDGATLERIRERPNGEMQILRFCRIPVSSSDSKSIFVKARAK